MSKSVKTFIAVAAMLAVAAPAMADFKFSGEFRVQGNHYTSAHMGEQDARSHNIIQQRFRPKLDYRVNDLISLTYFAEVDTVWGETLATGRDGRVGSDGYNVQTKNLYADIKIPQIDSNFRLGLQGLRDSFSGVVFFDDMAAANLTGKLPMNIDYQLFYSKWDTNAYAGRDRVGLRTEYKDTDFYGVDVSHRYGDFAKAGVAVYYLDNKSMFDVDNVPAGGEGLNLDAEMWWAGLYGDYRFANLAFQGFALYQFGEVLDNAPTNTYVDSEAWAASAKASMILPNGDIGLRYIWFSADDSETDADRFYLSQGNYEFTDENLMIFLVDKWVNNEGKNRRAITDAVEAGYGLHALVASGNFRNLPMNTYVNLGAGAFFVSDKNPDGGDFGPVNRTLGYEIAARIGKVFADKFDVSLRGAYAFLDDFYDDADEDRFNNNNDANDVYSVALMARIPF
ncbi:hypothetical protein SAMN05660860_01267 [Geoalkalibacter ferrihydriticus]|uniref:Uncharacterized protein n=2 Tax=Geoalkalibacter ferrihydriticus TaxID=392333 RepID=A0A0C2HYE8_9BACT|nr:hypothetical protein [Geoalkalibacter ferrihydriticus]KIH77772.1 hypothetical protein GFER_03745 [Geoalkalibacter ferrihydriticus DSM 17813]SDL78206.1 hypothetical protein SAMN05660860_01267 [Geoalkalibacter ferrihydriticus]